MEIKNVKENDVNVIYISGRVDTVSASELEEAVRPLYDESETLVFDCTEMDYISSSGLRVFLSAHKQMASKGKRLVLRHLHKEVYSVIQMTGFTRIFNLEN